MRPHRVDRERSQETRRARTAVQALNFFMADAQAGIGPFLGVFLQARGWGVGPIGAVMTIGGIAGMIVTIPAGALVDATTRKRSYIIVSAIFTLLASALIWVSQSFWVIAGSQVATAIAGAAPRSTGNASLRAALCILARFAIEITSSARVPSGTSNHATARTPRAKSSCECRGIEGNLLGSQGD